MEKFSPEIDKNSCYLTVYMPEDIFDDLVQKAFDLNMAKSRLALHMIKHGLRDMNENQDQDKIET